MYHSRVRSRLLIGTLTLMNELDPGHGMASVTWSARIIIPETGARQAPSPLPRRGYDRGGIDNDDRGQRHLPVRAEREVGPATQRLGVGPGERGGHRLPGPGLRLPAQGSADRRVRPSRA